MTGLGVIHEAYLLDSSWIVCGARRIVGASGGQLLRTGGLRFLACVVAVRMLADWWTWLMSRAYVE